MQINKIVEEIKKGNLVITPTDTVYGILADALNKEAIDKVFIAKKRENKPLLIIMTKDMLDTYIEDISPLEQELINRYLPGKLTILLKKNKLIDDSVTCGSPLVGVRIPNHSDLLEIIQRVGHPLISTSANISNQETITSVEKIDPDLLKYISYIEDGGIIKESSSTIIQVKDHRIQILREGELTPLIRKEYSKQIK